MIDLRLGDCIDVLKTLEELWEIKPIVENLDEKTIKWNNIRETVIHLI